MRVREEWKSWYKLNIQKTKIITSSPITSWQTDGETMETVTDFIFLGSKITADSDSSHEIKRCLLLRRKCQSHSVMSDSLTWAVACQVLCPWNSPGKNTGVGSCSLLQGNLPNPGIKPRSPILQVDSLPSEPPGKIKNTGLGSLSLLQGIFLNQVSNWGLLHCRQIL